jgi:hypothetical protein
VIALMNSFTLPYHKGILKVKITIFLYFFPFYCRLTESFHASSFILLGSIKTITLYTRYVTLHYVT